MAVTRVSEHNLPAAAACSQQDVQQLLPLLFVFLHFSFVFSETLSAEVGRFRKAFRWSKQNVRVLHFLNMYMRLVLKVNRLQLRRSKELQVFSTCFVVELRDGLWIQDIQVV